MSQFLNLSFGILIWSALNIDLFIRLAYEYEPKSSIHITCVYTWIKS